MKKYIIKLSLIAFITVLYSCELNSDFLNRYPLDRISNETFWNTENDLLVYK